MIDRTRFHGFTTALMTPFADGKIDAKCYQDFVAWQIAEGIHGVVPCGTTGESATLSHDEHQQVIKLCLEVVKGKVPVIAGCGSNCTEEAISLVRFAEKAGADAALQVVPYYNKPTQEGLYQHFKAIHDATELPIILYNVPGRTVVSLGNETIARLAELPRIVGIKDATGDITRPVKTRLGCGTDFRQLTGEDCNVLAFLALGGHGCISVTSNVAPRMCAELYNAYAAGDMETANSINDKLMPLHDAMFAETSPGPLKYAAAKLGLCRYELRLPMVPISKANEKIMDEALRKVGLSAADAVLRKA
jgi:4-hydroxy-tetrahydrodipicolinate synthase